MLALHGVGEVHEDDVCGQCRREVKAEGVLDAGDADVQDAEGEKKHAQQHVDEGAGPCAAHDDRAFLVARGNDVAGA